MNEPVNPVENKGYFLVVPPQKQFAYIDWAAFAKTLLRRWWILLLGGLLCGGLGFYHGYYVAKTLYRATVVVAVDNAGVPDGFAIPGQLSGIASLAGINLPRMGQSRRQEYIATLSSRSLIGTYITQKNLIPILRPEDYEATQRGERARPLTLGETVDYFKDQVLTVTEDRPTGLLNIHLDWYDRELAPIWISEFITLANERIRETTISEARASLDFLRAQSARETVEAVRQSIARIMETKLNETMMANVSTNFPFRVIDPPEVPYRGIWPPRLLEVVGGFLVGAFLFGLFVTFFHRHQVFKRDWVHPKA